MIHDVEKWEGFVEDWVDADADDILNRGDTRSRLATIRLGFLKSAKLLESDKRRLYDDYLEKITDKIGNRRGQVNSYDGKIIWIGG